MSDLSQPNPNQLVPSVTTNQSTGNALPTPQAQIESLQRSMGDQLDEVRELRTKLENYRKENESLESRNRTLLKALDCEEETEYDVILDHIRQLNHAHDKLATIDDLESERNSLRAQLETAEKQIAEQQTEISGTLRRLADIDGFSSRICTTLNLMQEERDNLRAKLEAAQKELVGVSAQHADMLEMLGCEDFGGAVTETIPLLQERDKLFPKMLEALRLLRANCPSCRNSRSVGVKHGITYETDTAYERAQAWHVEPCPKCAAVAERAIAEAEALERGTE